MNQELRLQLKQAVEQIPRSERQQEEDAFASPDDTPIVSNEIEHTETSGKPLREYLSEEMLQQLPGKLGNSESALDVFLALIKAGGRSRVETLKETLNINQINVEHGLGYLKQHGLANETADRAWILTTEGREIAVNIKLTNLFT